MLFRKPEEIKQKWKVTNKNKKKSEKTGGITNLIENC